MAANITNFLRLQTDDWLTSLATKVADDLLENVEYTSLSLGGKAVGQQKAVKTDVLAEQLALVLTERGLGGAQQDAARPRQTVAQFF